MNINNLERFHNYLCAVVAYYRAHRTLKNFSSLAKEYKVKAITRELFFQYELDKLDGELNRELSYKIRHVIADIDMNRRQQQLATFFNDQQKEEKKAKEEDDADFRLERFEAHMEKVNGFIRAVKKTAWTWSEKTIDDIRFEPAEEFNDTAFDVQNLRNWKDQVEYEAAKSFFGSMATKDICNAVPKMQENTMHAFLTYIFGDENGKQLKFDFDAKGNKSPQNDAIEQALAEYGIFNDVLFHKIESWEGRGHLCVVYKDAPDVLMIVSDEKHDFYGVDDDVFYCYCGDTIIDPGNTIAYSFDGWGTRSIMAECIKTVNACKNEAVGAQKRVPSALKGKLMDDLNCADEIRKMYREENMRKTYHQ